MDTITLQWETDFFNNALINNPRLEFSLNSNLNRSSVKFSYSGIYIIWAATNPRTILKVGSGQIKNRLQKHINDPKVQPYKPYSVYVTWAILPLGTMRYFSVDKYTDTLRGIEKFIGFIYPPKLTQLLPVKVDFVFVNIPELETPLQKLLKFTGRDRPEQKIPYGSPLAQALASLNRNNQVFSNPYRTQLEQALASSRGYNQLQSNPYKR